MRSIFCQMLTGLPLALSPALVAHGTSAAGTSGDGWFWAGGALILSLLLHRTVVRFAHRLNRRFEIAALRRAISEHSDRVVDDVILPGAYGGLARIDHVVLTPHGLVCIRRIVASGTIFGDDAGAQWTRVNGPARRRFLNPLIQNEGRRRALEKALPGVPVTSLVVFCGNVQFSLRPPDCIRRDELDAWFRRFSFGPVRITDQQRVWEELRAVAKSDEATKADFEAQVGFG